MIIIHQMAKVGSTAIDKALKRAGIDCLQTHNLGEHHLHNNLTSFLSPLYTAERVRNELRLFTDQIIATKQVETSRLSDSPRQKIITLSRDPVDRWFSALIQNFTYLQPNVSAFFLEQNGRRPDTDLECFAFMLDKLLRLITESELLLGSHAFNEYFWHSRHLDSEQANNILLQVGAELMVPFTWFQSNIQDLIGIDLYAQPISDGLLTTGNENFDLLYIKFEKLRKDRLNTQRALSEFVGKKIKLKAANVSRGKAGYTVIRQLEASYASRFMACPNIRDSNYCKHFHYPDHI